MYQKDYIRAGFKVDNESISKMLNDPVKASREMRLMCLLGVFSWLGMAA